MTTPTPPADDQPGSVEVSERDRQEAGKLVAYCAVTALMPDVERHQRVAELLAAYRREIEGRYATLMSKIASLEHHASTINGKEPEQWMIRFIDLVNALRNAAKDFLP